MKILRPACVAAGLAAPHFALSSAAAQTIIAPKAGERLGPIPVPVPPPAQAAGDKTLGTGPAHAYLFHGLMNIFSLRMDDLAQRRARRRGCEPL